MLLEVNRAQHLIVDRPPRDQVERWAKLCGVLPTCVLVADDVQWWTERLPEETCVISFDDGYGNEIAGNISAALTALNAQPHNSVYVSFDPLDIAEAVRTRIGTLLFSEGMGETLPDLFTDDGAQIEVAICDLATGRPHGHMVEQFSMRYGYGDSPGATGYIHSQPYLRGRPDLDAAIAHDLEVVIAGRYFPETEARHAKHQPSWRLLSAKRGDKRGTPLATAFGHVLGLVLENDDDIDLITRIPPKPTKADHLGTFLETAAAHADKRLGSEMASLIELSALRCLREYGEQKKAGNYAKRVENVRGAFAADRHVVRGKKVLLVDDVLTSGATIVEAARCLYAAGALRVVACPIAINQKAINYNSDYELPCPRPGCEGNMRIRFARDNEGAFWGCDQWRADGSGCGEIMKFDEGLIASNLLTDRDEIVVIEDFPF